MICRAVTRLWTISLTLVIRLHSYTQGRRSQTLRRWCVFPPDGLRHSRASALPRVCRWSIRWPVVQPRSPISLSSMRLGLPSGCSTFREHTSNSSSLWRKTKAIKDTSQRRQQVRGNQLSSSIQILEMHVKKKIIAITFQVPCCSPIPNLTQNTHLLHTYYKACCSTNALLRQTKL